jgi:hypothetical protein
MSTVQHGLRYYFFIACLTLSVSSYSDVYGPSASSGNFTITWDPVFDGPRQFLNGYWVEERFNGGQITKHYPSETTITFNRTKNGSYYYEVFARGEICSAGSEPVCFERILELGSVTVVITIPKPSTPTSFNVPNATVERSYTVSWSTASGLVDYYQLRERSESSDWIILPPTNTLSYTLTNKLNGIYYYQLAACNESGCSNYTSEKFITVLAPPDAPATVSLPSASSDGSYTLSWSAVNGSSSYQVSEKIKQASWGEFASVGNTTQRNFSGQFNGQFQYRVRACNVGGCGLETTSATITVSRDTAYRIEFIHTDLLGSPVTESDNTGALK